jgi:SAM-dependent methyltransferase
VNDQRASRIRAAYGRSAHRYAAEVGTNVDGRFETGFDLALLDAFVDAAPAGDVLDAGCGVGRIARRIHDRGRAVRGTDLVPEMIAEASRAHPMIRFDVAPLTAQPADPAEFAAVVAWYSVIATPPDELAGVWREIARVLGPDGAVLVAFQAGEGERRRLEDAYGTGATLDLFHHAPDAVVAGLTAAGFVLDWRAERAPVLAHEFTPQAFVAARRAD